jgi:hypothetical protein
MPKKIDSAVKERAVRMVREHREDYPSVTAAAAAGVLGAGRPDGRGERTRPAPGRPRPPTPVGRRGRARGRRHRGRAGLGKSTHAEHTLLTAGIDLPVRFARLYAHLSAGLIEWDKALPFLTRPTS